MDMELDTISNLPGHIIEKILTCLPVRDAVRTSVLSSKWRYKWVTLSQLVFDNMCISLSSQDQKLIKNKLVNIVDHVLLLHVGPILKFHLSHRALQSSCDIDRWILFLSRNGIKEFVLEIWTGGCYKMPSCFFSCQQLSHLELLNCLLKPPPTFKGFGSLKSLDLQHITLAQDLFENLISSCPLLEKLTLVNFDGFTHLKIHAPNLLYCYIGGEFEDIIFENASLLASVLIGLYTYVGNDKPLEHGKICNLLEFLDCLPGIRRLEVQTHFLQYLALGNVPERLPVSCVHLKVLSININFKELKDSLTTLCLLRSSPNVQEIEMLACSEERTVLEPVTDFWKAQSHSSCSFNQLQLVKIVGISSLRPEMDFIHFVLANSPVLEKMTIKPGVVDNGWAMVKEMLRFQ